MFRSLLKNHRKVKLDFPSSCQKRHIFAETWINDNARKPKKHFIFFHDICLHHRYFEGILHSLYSDWGDELQVSFWDLYGHGKSGGERSWIDSSENFSRDAISLLAQLKEFYDENDRVFFIGEGFGANIIIDLFTGDYGDLAIAPERVVLANPLIKILSWGERSSLKVLSFLRSNFSKLSMPLLFNAQDLSNCEEWQIEFESDPLLSQFLTVGLVKEVIACSQKLRELAHFYKIPSLVLLSEDDVICETQASKQYFHDSSANIELEIYNLTYHHLFSGKIAPTVYNRISQYIKEVI